MQEDRVDSASCAVLFGMRSPADPKLTEEFLLTQEDVLDASVWLSGEHLHAHVTPAPGRHLNTGDLKGACTESIGEHQTPDQIHVFAAQGKSG